MGYGVRALEGIRRVFFLFFDLKLLGCDILDVEAGGSAVRCMPFIEPGDTATVPYRWVALASTLFSTDLAAT